MKIADLHKLLEPFANSQLLILFVSEKFQIIILNLGFGKVGTSPWSLILGTPPPALHPPKDLKVDCD
jgi:hypothetical protein